MSPKIATASRQAILLVILLLAGGPPSSHTVGASRSVDMAREIDEASLRGNGYDMVTGEEVLLMAGLVLAYPGARVLIGDSCLVLTHCASCTLGFLYGTHGGYRFITAEHCVVGSNAYVLPAPGIMVRIGTAGSSPHFKLRFLDVLPSMQDHVDPDGWGIGTTGVHRGTVTGADRIPVVSWGQPWGLDGLGVHAPMDYGGLPRFGITFDVNPSQSAFLCTCAFFSGDSGGPVWDLAGRAFGIVQQAGPEGVATFASVVSQDPAVGDRVPVSLTNLAPCLDGMDNDGDGQTDGADADCWAPVGTGEATPPECRDTYNNDNDLYPDWPLDPDCDSPSDPSESS